MSKRLSTTKKTVKTDDKKPHYFSDEAKKERYDKRMTLITDHLSALKDNNQLLGKSSPHLLDEKKLKSAGTMFKRLSLKELETILAVFIQCEQAGQTAAIKELAS